MFFRSLIESDEQIIFDWIQNKELRKMIGTRGESNVEGHKKWFANKINSDSNIIKIIETEEGPVGIIGTNTLDLINLNAEMYLYIGKTDVRGKGYGAEAVRKFVDYLFEQYKLRKVTARIFAFNLPSIKLFEKCGFKLEGMQKEQILFDSEKKQFCDLLWYAYFSKDVGEKW